MRTNQMEEEEEEEEEEVVEVEEEEEEEEEDDDDDDDDKLDSSKESNVELNDVGQHKEVEGQLVLSSTLGRSELGLQSNSHIQDSISNPKLSGPLDESLTFQEKVHVNYEDSECSKSGDCLLTTGGNESQQFAVEKDVEAFVKKNSQELSKHNGDCKVHLCNDKSISDETTSPSIARNEVSNALAIKDCLSMDTNGILDSEVEVKPMEMQPEDKEQTASRVVTSEIRAQSPSPSAEFKDWNKRPAVICNFFAKGWCIRGSSCRFLHINNKADNAKEQLEGDAAVSHLSKGDQFDEGLKNIMEKPKLSGFPDLVASSIGNGSAFPSRFSSEKILPFENGESQLFHQLDEQQKSSSLPREDLSRGVHPDTQQFPSSKGDLGVSSSLKDLGKENLRQSWPASDYGRYASAINRGSSPSFQSRLLPEHQCSSSGVAVTSSNHRGWNSSSYLSSLDNQACIRGQYVHGSYLDSSFSGSSMLPSHQISAWKGPSFSLTSSMNISPLGSQKLLGNDRDFCASRSSPILQTASPRSGSELENVPLTSVSKDPLCYTEHKAKIFSNDWEPSIPFRPSFFITHTMTSSPGSQYDPLRDSIDLPTAGYKLPFKFSFVSQVTSNLNSSHLPTYGNSVSQTLGPECDNDKSTVSSHSRFHENVLGQNCFTPGKVVGGNSAVNVQKETKPKEENTSSSSHLNNVPNKRKIDIDCDSRQTNDGPRRKKDLKVDRVRQKNEMDVEQKTDGESRTLRHFRAALVDFVKELLRPTWREGHLSKDAHNKIVKKTVEKVLCTLQPHQIPTTIESIKQYLSSCQPKIAKLIEGYCTKYGKS